MPKIWEATINEHRVAVRNAILDTTAELVSEHGALSVTMSQIAQATRIGRATLYKYFPDVEAILAAWHDRHVAAHLAHLAEIGDAHDAGQRLEAVLTMHAMMTFQHRGSAMAAATHRPSHRQQNAFIEDAISRAADVGTVRSDLTPRELTNYCLHAIEAASDLSSRAAVQRLVHVTLDGLRHCD